MNYGRYNRSVTVLSGQSRDFSAREGGLSGHLKVETGNNKGAMRCTVDNLRPWPKGEYIYKLILFGSRGERTIHALIGTIPVSKTGTGEAYFRFNPLDVDGKGNGYQRFTTAIVASVSMRSDREPLHPILKGETGNDPGEIQTRAASLDGGREGAGEGGEARRQKEELLDGKEGEALEEEIGEPQREGDGAVMEGGTAEAGGAEKRRPVLETDRAETGLGVGRAETGLGVGRMETGLGVGRTETGLGVGRAETGLGVGRTEAGSEDGHGVFCGQKGGSRRPRDCFNRFYNEHVLHTCIYTCQVAEYYEEVKPFREDRTGARWKRIVNITNLPLVSPGAHYYASLYRHYLFGARPDRRGYASCYFFAIPGRNMEAEQPDGGRSGFRYWQAMKGSEEQKNPYGYWILQIDGQTGDILEVSIEKLEEV